MTTPYLDALEEAADASAAPVEAATARARMRAALAPEQLAVLDDPSRFVACRTARAAGKSATLVSDVLEQMTSVDDWRGCYGALTQDSGKEQLWDELRRQDKAFGFGLKFLEHDATVYYPPTGGRLRIRDVANLRAVNKWRGKQYHRVYLDECQSMDDEVLSYAAVVVLPPTLSRHRGSIRIAGTPRRRRGGWWYEVTSRRGQEAAMRADGRVRAMSRPYVDRDDPHWATTLWSWSLHSWPRSANPGLADADREADEMRRALAATAEDEDAIRVELDGEWPDEGDDDEGLLYKFNDVRDCWDVMAGAAADPPYGLQAGHDWRFYLGADLAMKRDAFAITIGACAPTSRIAYHCDEFEKKKLTVEQMAAEINKFRAALGNRLVAMVGDSQGPKGAEIFEELQRVHKIPLEKAEKAYKDDAIELVSSDLVAGRMKIKRGSRLATQLAKLRRPKPNTPASKQPHQEDDVADSWLYCRRRMTHGFGHEGAAAPDAKKERERKQLRAMAARRQGGDPWSSLRTLGARGRSW